MEEENEKTADTTLVTDNDEPENPAALKDYGYTDEQIAALLGSDENEEANADGEKKEEEEASPPSPDEIDLEALKAAAEFGTKWKVAFTNNPEEAILALLQTDAFNNESKQAILNKLQEENASPLAITNTFDVKGYEPQSDLEAALMPAFDWIREGKQVVEKEFALRDADLQYTYAQAKIVESKVDALLGILGYDLPKYDVKEVLKAFNSDENLTIDAAVSKVYGETLKEASKLEKQKKEVKRPDSLRNMSAGGGKNGLPKVKNFGEAWELAGAMLGSNNGD